MLNVEHLNKRFYDVLTFILAPGEEQLIFIHKSNFCLYLLSFSYEKENKQNIFIQNKQFSKSRFCGLVQT